jgi:hypothetical protein
MLIKNYSTLKKLQPISSKLISAQIRPIKIETINSITLKFDLKIQTYNLTDQKWLFNIEGRMWKI